MHRRCRMQLRPLGGRGRWHLQYPEEFFDCDGNCLNDADLDGVCDDIDISGCTDDMACNYNAEAAEDDGSCEYTSCVVSGCTDALACNYNAEATEDDGSCDYCSCQRPPTPYTLVVEGAPAVVSGMTTYRFYVSFRTRVIVSARCLATTSPPWR